MSSNKEVKIDRLRYDPERLKLLLEQLAVEAGITLLYETELTAAREGEEECQITARGAVLGDRPLRKIPDRRHRKRLPGPGAGRGDGGGGREGADDRHPDVPHLQRGPGPAGRLYPQPRLGETIRQGRESGVLKGGILAFTPIPGTRDVSLNVTRAKFDHEDLADATGGWWS